jgi:hypothetical protein
VPFAGNKVSAPLGRLNALPKPITPAQPQHRANIVNLAPSQQTSLMDIQSSSNVLTVPPANSRYVNTLIKPVINKPSTKTPTTSVRKTKNDKNNKLSTFPITYYLQDKFNPTLPLREIPHHPEKQNKPIQSDPIHSTSKSSLLGSVIRDPDAMPTQYPPLLNPPQSLLLNYLSVSDQPSTGAWHPHQLPVLRSDHPFDVACRPTTISLIQRICKMHPELA